MPYDHDGDWPASSFLVGWGPSADEGFITYTTATGWSLRCDATTVAEEAYTFHAGDWLDIIATMDYASDVYRLYINGIKVSEDTGRALTMGAAGNWRLGARQNGTLTGNFTFGEFAVFDRELTAVEVAGIYALQRPTVDITTFDKPGIHLMEIVSGDLDDISDGTTYSKVLTTSIAAGKIVLSETTGDLDDIADGATYGKLKQTIISAGFIQVGAGTKDADLDGISIDNTELVAQAAGVDQVVIGVDGKLKAGGGSVRLDATGISLVRDEAIDNTQRLVFYYNDVGTERVLGRFFGDWGGAGSNTSWVQAWRVAGDPWTGAKVTMAAIDNVAATDVRITVDSAGNIDMGGTIVNLASAKLHLDQGEIEFDAASGSNLIEIVDNIADALHISSNQPMEFMRFITSAAAEAVVIDPAGIGIEFGIGMIPPANSFFCVGLPTQNFEMLDAGVTGATQQAWVKVEIGGVMGYLHVFAAT